MDIFVSGAPSQSSPAQLKRFFRDHLRLFDILAFDCRKFNSKNGGSIVFITVPDVAKAQSFINYWQFSLGLQAPRFYGTLLVVKPGRNKPDEFHVKSLLAEQKKHVQKLVNPEPRTHDHHEGGFHFDHLTVGVWNYVKDNLSFDEQFRDPRKGAIVFGNSSMEVHVEGSNARPRTCRVDIDYSAVDNMVLGVDGLGRPTLTVALIMPPKFYRIEDAPVLHIANLMDAISLHPRNMSGGISLVPNKKQLTRVSGIDPTHEKLAGLCMVYRIILPDHDTFNNVRRLFQAKRATGMSKLPQFDIFGTLAYDFRSPIDDAYAIFCNWLANTDMFHSITFPIRFQLHSLVLDGFLTPQKVFALLPGIEAFAQTERVAIVASAVKKVRFDIPYPSRTVSEEKFTTVSLLKTIREYISYEKDKDPMQDLVVRHEHLTSVYKATITPTGMFLRGPDPEISNRILRKYGDHSECFLRVQFADEDGTPVQFDYRASQDDIWDRFRNFLRNGLLIAGRRYEFLGFSHSSLRSQTSWFMTPFEYEGELLDSEKLIRGIGDFSHIRSPAKCAARIGQAFSDTTTAITLSNDNIWVIPDVERNGRCFSDGCGTVSKALLKKIWKKLPSGRFLQPTVLQIRFRGAKGMISLDSRVPGEYLWIRESMLKFEAGSVWNDIELCGAGYKPLPCFLNRQFIKILEDLRIHKQVFLNLQTKYVNHLRLISRDPVNAAGFLESCFMATAAKIPMLIRLLNDIGLLYRNDQFLTDVIEIAVMAKLRDMKYRGRIPVEKGVVLYGIMDETGILKENQIYVATRKKTDSLHFEDWVLVQKRVAITRAPALHPGDIQIVEAVDIPVDSPLKQLYNCVVFSQHGERDLPSKLSGGDLDGDLFNVIYDESLVPPFAVTPADYPRPQPVDLGRPVTTGDMTDFFVDFMKSDQLGRISNLHMSMADRLEMGTFAPGCIQLAELASIAVDFSKSGVPADQSKIPKVDPTKPDFMAPGPRVILEKRVAIEGADWDDEDDDVDPLNLLNPTKKRTLYYESEKVLGHLYRAIDERKFFQQLRSDLDNMPLGKSKKPIMQQLWEYVKREAAYIQWDHHKQFAEDLRDTYESNLLDTMISLSPHPRHHLSEVEVFTGNILGKSRGRENKRTREANKDLAERFNRDVAFIVRQITQAEEYDDNVADAEVLPRAIACFEVGMQEKKIWRCQSFKYVAASVCLLELWKFRGGRGLRMI